MDTLTIEPRRNWLIQVLGRNPLVRRSDRIEAWWDGAIGRHTEVVKWPDRAKEPVFRDERE